MIVIYFVCLIIVMLIFLISKVAQGIVGKKIKKTEFNISLYELAQMCKNQLTKELIKDISISVTGFYAYNRAKKVLCIQKKKVYNSLDVFIVFHEIGHICDDKNLYSKIYGMVANIKIVLLILWMPVISTNLWLMSTVDVYIVIRIIIYTLTGLDVMLGICVGILNIIIEIRASSYALSKKQFAENKCLFKLNTKLAILDQISIWLMFELPIVFVFMCTN